jgi:Xaa-Pro aminopeptidase
MNSEFQHKLALVRGALQQHHFEAVIFRSHAWFAWVTCGGDNSVLNTTDGGVAEVIVTASDVYVLTDEIEAERLSLEQLPSGMTMLVHPWADPQARTDLQRQVAGVAVAADLPRTGEHELPNAVQILRFGLHPAELERYRQLGLAAARAMTEVLGAAQPTWTGHQLAGAGAEVLLVQGIEPAVVLVGDEARLGQFRHPTPSHNPIGGAVMLVFCARRYGLFANLTRFCYFRELTPQERTHQTVLLDIEAQMLAVSKVGASLGDIYQHTVAAYQRAGYPNAERAHHQGGSCGYQARDAIALPNSQVRLQEHNAVAWNPSLPGAKIEDTIVVSKAGLEVITADPAWATRTVAGLPRPEVWVR